MRKFTLATAVLLALGTQAVAQEKLKVGYIYVGPIGDFGWSYQHDLGRQAVVKALGDKVETTYLENVSEGPDAERSIEQLARSGHKLIFTTSFGFMDSTVKVAKKYPNLFFEHATGYKREKNLATYSGRFYEGRYIQGVIAAKMSKAGVMGYIGSVPIPEVISGITAAKRGIPAFGQDSDMIKFGPKTQLTAIIDNWGPYYVERTKLVLDGKWTSTDTWGGLNSKMVVMAPYTNMPDDVKKLAEDTEAAISSGERHPFKCPVVAQDGSTVECKG